ncbi:hypothetical protein GGD87_000872 [Rhodobaca bogoriensis DSM 18756]|nr:hypothetical protein [Rhodobaca bogoriensis DSM 18756]
MPVSCPGQDDLRFNGVKAIREALLREWPALTG